MIKFELVTLDGTKFSEDIYEVRLPTPQGEIGIFPHHMPLVSIASHGVITVRRKKTDPDQLLEYFASNGGVIEILDNQVRVLVDEADREDEVNEKEALKAFDQAHELKKKARDQMSLQKAQQMVDRSQTRLKVAELRRRKRKH